MCGIMSAVDIPPSIMKKKSTEAYGGNPASGQALVDMSDLIKSNNVAANVSSILQRKSNVGGYVDTTRHTIESQDNGSGTKSLSIVKRAKVPSSQAVATVSKQKMTSTSIFHPARNEQVTDIVSCAKNQDIATVSGKGRVSKNKQKYPFGDTPIYNTTYHEMTDNILNEMESSSEYDMKKVSRKPSEAPRKPSKEDNVVWTTGDEDTPWEFGKAQRTKSVEPADFAVISDAKTKVKQSLKKRPVQQVTAAETFDFLVDQFRGKPVNKDQTQKVKKHSLKSHIVHGMQDVNEICEEIGKIPNVQRIKAQPEADMRHMRSAGRRARNSIAAIGNKRTLNAGSLVKQYGTTAYNTGYSGSTSTSYGGIYCKYERGLGGRPEVHFYSSSGRRITHTQVAQVLPQKIINRLKQEAKKAILGQPVQTNKVSPTPVQPIQTIQSLRLIKVHRGP
jgi:hypothetical protein